MRSGRVNKAQRAIRLIAREELNSSRRRTLNYPNTGVLVAAVTTRREQKKHPIGQHLARSRPGHGVLV